MTGARIPIIVQIDELNPVEGELYVFAAPLTVNEVIKRLPVEGFIARWPNAVYIITEISRGVEKTTSKLLPGDIFYWSPEKAIGIALSEHMARSQTIRIGSVGEGFREVSRAKIGARMRIVSKTF
ncbi:MAG: cyclophilin-like family protein [Candidatus Caldarchaeum sp.]